MFGSREKVILLDLREKLPGLLDLAKFELRNTVKLVLGALFGDTEPLREIPRTHASASKFRIKVREQ